MSHEPADARPLHMRVTAALRQRVIAGEFPVGSRIPSLRALAEEYQVSEVTAHTAIRTLQHEEVLESASGRGTFVKAVPKPEGTDVLQELQAQVGQMAHELRELADRVETLEGHAR